LDKITEFCSYELRVRDKRQVPAPFEDLTLGVPKACDQLSQALRRDQKVALSRECKCRARDPRQTRGQVKAFDEMQPMGHDALIRLPALPRNEFEQRTGLASAEKEVEELIDEWAIGRQWVTRKHQTSNPLNQAPFKTYTNALYADGAHAMGISSSKGQSQDAAERQPDNDGAFESSPIDKLMEVVHKIIESEAPSQCETVVLAAKLVADHQMVASQFACQRAKNLKAARQSRDQDDRWAFAPFAIPGGIVPKVSQSRTASQRLKPRTADG
jgi:hypothetical protein